MTPIIFVCVLDNDDIHEPEIGEWTGERTRGDAIVSGREEYAHCGIIGLGVDQRDWGRNMLFHGYDGDLEHEEDPLTNAEKAELAEHMIESWKKYAESIKGDTLKP